MENSILKLDECVADEMERRLGCSLPWRNSTVVDQDSCQEGKFVEFSEGLADRFFWTVEDVRKTKCRTSCTTMKYKFVRSLDKTMGCQEFKPFCSK